MIGNYLFSDALGSQKFSVGSDPSMFHKDSGETGSNICDEIQHLSGKNNNKQLKEMMYMYIYTVCAVYNAHVVFYCLLIYNYHVLNHNSSV